MPTPVIAVTAGEPAGIGPDLCVQLAACVSDTCLVYIGDPAVFGMRARALRLPFSPTVWNKSHRTTPGIYVLPITANRPAIPGQLDPRNAAYVIDTLAAGVDGCLAHDFDALVTAPVNKAIINDAGIPFTGHTEFIGKRCGVEPVMMLACPDLRVALATTHVPLADVSARITRDGLKRTLRTLHRDLQTKFKLATPRIAVCGLNPHAGESGHLGREEIETIQPVIDELRREGMQLRGPLPADTAFVRKNLQDVDAVLAMYHDQGLPVIKHHDFARTVNVTLGLPFARTSPDHGTALNLAGTGAADPTSFYAAVDMARQMCP